MHISGQGLTISGTVLNWRIITPNCNDVMSVIYSDCFSDAIVSKTSTSNVHINHEYNLDGM